MVTNLNSTRGFVTALSVVISLAILIFFGAIYHVVQNSVRENIVIDLRDQSGAVAEAAVQQVINKVRANPNLEVIEEKLQRANGTPLTLAEGKNLLPDSLGFYDVYHRNFPNDLKDQNSKLLGRYF